MTTKKRNPHRKFVWLVILITIFAGSLDWYWQHLLSPVNPAAIPQVFTITPGEPTTKISSDLQEQGFIRSSSAFNVLVKKTGQAGKIQAGNFQIAASMSARQILDTLVSGGVMEKKVTLLEGWRVEEMAAKLNQDLGIKPADFLAVAKEGYMFPDTYSFNDNVTAEEVAKTMRDNFNQKYTPELQDKIRKLGLTPDQGVILASIVEREGRSDGVRQEIASILLKRLKIGMALDVDASIQYALGYQPAEKSWWKRYLAAGDLKIKSDYNTYLNPGLPPGPISNPSLSSLEAVASANPNTPYLYYYHDSEGNSYYAKTLDQQNANVANHP